MKKVVIFIIVILIVVCVFLFKFQENKIEKNAEGLNNEFLSENEKNIDARI